MARQGKPSEAEGLAPTAADIGLTHRLRSPSCARWPAAVRVTLRVTLPKTRHFPRGFDTCTAYQTARSLGRRARERGRRMPAAGAAGRTRAVRAPLDQPLPAGAVCGAPPDELCRCAFAPPRALAPPTFAQRIRCMHHGDHSRPCRAIDAADHAASRCARAAARSAGRPAGVRPTRSGPCGRPGLRHAAAPSATS